MAVFYNYSKSMPPKSNITDSFTITDVKITTARVLTIPCLSIQFAMRPGIMLPITATEPTSEESK